MAKRIAGIYFIKNVENNKLLIGSSNDITYRWYQKHLKFLYAGKHWNSHLQSSWNKYGPNVFQLGMLEYIQYTTNNKLLDLVLKSKENIWMAFYKTLDNKYGYNKQDAFNQNISPETIAKLSATHKELSKTSKRQEQLRKAQEAAHTPEAIAKQLATNKIKKYGSLENYNIIVIFIKSEYVGKMGPSQQTTANMIFEKFGIKISKASICRIASSM